HHIRCQTARRRCHPMAGDLTLRITVTEIETLQKNRLHVAGECGRRGRCGHQHFVAAVDQVPRAGLMKRRCELVVDVPAIMVTATHSHQGCPPTFQPDSSMVTLGPIRTWLMRSW